MENKKFYPKEEILMGALGADDNVKYYIFPQVGRINMSAKSRVTSAITGVGRPFVNGFTTADRDGVHKVINPARFQAFEEVGKDVPTDILTKIQQHEALALTEANEVAIRGLEAELDAYFSKI